MSRADVGPYVMKGLPPFYFYVDEFQNFANESFASILSEARKYKLALTVAHQYVEQMTDEVKAAVFGNVGTMITFRVGATDAEAFEKEFAPYFILDDFVNLSAFQIYIRLMIDGQGSKPFSAKTLDPIQKPPQSYADAIIANSRLVNGKPKHLVEEEINDFYKPTPKPVAVKKPEGVDSEKEVKVREIKDDTPLPTKTEIKEETNQKEQQREQKKDASPLHKERHTAESRGGPRSDSQRGGRNDIRNGSRNDLQRLRSEPLRDKDQVKFDNAPALSLKDALAKALKEAEGLKKDVNAVVSNEGPPNAHSTQEVSEDVLRKLLED
jgi:hypothetical protein